MKKVLMKDIAKQANVTVATVSYVLNNVEGQTISEETRKRILEIAKEIGYVPNLTAKALASKKSGLIGVMTVKNHSIAGSWKDILYCRLINELECSLRKIGYHLLISSVDAANPELDIILQRELEGVFLLDVREDAFYNISTRFSVPIILVDSYLNDDLFVKIVPDFEAAIHKAKEMLDSSCSFIIADKVNNKGYADRIKEASGLSEEDILFAENEEDAASFLKKRENQKGICINECLAVIAGKYISFRQMAVICTCGFPSLLPQDVKTVEFNENKAEIIIDVMKSLIDKIYSNGQSRYKFIGVKD